MMFSFSNTIKLPFWEPVKFQKVLAWCLPQAPSESAKLPLSICKECSRSSKPIQREEREKHYISSSHLGLIRCLTPFRVRISTIASI